VIPGGPIQHLTEINTKKMSLEVKEDCPALKADCLTAICEQPVV
jgi:hypothetical protein